MLTISVIVVENRVALLPDIKEQKRTLGVYAPFCHRNDPDPWFFVYLVTSLGHPDLVISDASTEDGRNPKSEESDAVSVSD